MKKALLLIEFQEEWLNPNGKLYARVDNPKRLEDSMQQAKKVLAHARKNGWLIAHSGLGFDEDYTSLGQAKLGLRSHIPRAKTFIVNSQGASFHPDFAPQKNELIAQGRLGASAFAGSNLDHQLRNHHVTELYIMGYALHVCVESTLRASHDLGYETYIISDACAAFTQSQEDYFEQHIIKHFGKPLRANQLISGDHHG